MMKKIGLLEAAKRLNFFNFYSCWLINFVHSMFNSTHSQWKNMVAFVISFPQEVLGGRVGGLLHWGTAMDRTTVGEEFK